ncbi:short-chain dehydrogenase/oxidoreductase [Phlyctema vagabunda]|uniref:Short-chain dehydrogenase/oxidoreductase n=1 Tax=Phlyctema vagabunda TaxID=108571 RepID=A0ABR4PEP4_9HELO
MDSPVWFITGCSTGFGGTLAQIALKSGHRVIATSRSPSKTPELIQQIESLGGKYLQLDVCSPDLGTLLDEATAVYGRIDILVNNAGNALLGALETLSDEECRAQMETNFFAPLNIIRHVLPAMRERKSGVIVNISSTAGIEARATRSMYSGSKFALEGDFPSRSTFCSSTNDLQQCPRRYTTK